MSKLWKMSVLAGCLSLASLVPSRSAQACWCSPVYTTCCLYPVEYTVPVVSTWVVEPVPVVATVWRPQWVLETSYRRVTRWETSMVYVPRTYFDPVTWTYRTIYLRYTSYVPRSYLVPYSTYVLRWVADQVYTAPSSPVPFTSPAPSSSGRGGGGRAVPYTSGDSTASRGRSGGPGLLRAAATGDGRVRPPTATQPETGTQLAAAETDWRPWPLRRRD